MALLVDILCIFVIQLLFFRVNKLVKDTSSSFGAVEIDWIWRNTVSSLVHASISGIWALFYVGIPTAELFDYETTGSIWLTRFCCGYAAYDFLDYLWQPNRKNDISTVGIIVHHILTVLTLTLGLHYKATTYMSLGLMVEVNSFFLHIRRLFKLKKIPQESTAYQINNMFLFGTCVFFRFGLGLNIWYGLYFSGKRFPLWVTIWCAVVVFFFWVLSVYMIERIYHNDYRKRRKMINNNDVSSHKSNGVVS